MKQPVILETIDLILKMYISEKIAYKMINIQSYW